MSPYMIIGSPVFSADVTVPDFSTITSIKTALEAQLNTTTLISVLSGGITAVIGICFVWWAGRKLVKMFNSAFRRGKLRL